VVVKIIVGYASMICLLLLFSESKSELGLGSVSLSLTTNEFFERHSLVLCQGICGSRTSFECPSSSSHYPYFPMAWTSCLEVGCFVSYGCLYHTSVVADLQPRTPTYFAS
jgi:hypothetical protein